VSTRISLAETIDALASTHGEPAPPPVVDPFEQTVFETCCYLVDDDRRLEVWRRLKKLIGVTPAKLFAADQARIAAAIRDGGMRPADRAAKVLACAEIASEIGDLDAAANRPLDEARRVFERFPNHGRPGAERVLLFAGAHPVLALDSNGLRVLVRLGFAAESKSYDKTYRDVRAAVAPQTSGKEAAWLVRAHQLLRKHGQEICRRTRPECPRCPLRPRCAFAVGVTS
jgi:endonuclease III